MNHVRFVKMALALTAVVSLLSVGAWGSTFKVIYNFTGGTDGSRPVDAGNLAIDSNGNLYGTTQFGGACGARCSSYHPMAAAAGPRRCCTVSAARMGQARPPLQL